MAGEPIEAVEVGVYKMISALSRNPYAIETAYLSVITFAAKAKALVPLTEITSVQPPDLSLKPGTSLGAALELLRESIEREVVKTTSERKGDYKPLVFILTDGYPTDDWRGPLARLRAVKPSVATIYAIGCGEEVDFEALSQIADVCIHNKSLSTESMAKLFLWLSASVQSQSASPDAKLSLEKVPLEEGMELIDPVRPPKFVGRDRRLFFHMTCLKAKKPWLMIYKRAQDDDAYMADRAATLPPDFFSDGTMKSPPIDTSDLYGGVACPYCGADGWGKCSFCGHLFCIESDSELTEVVCPVCETSLSVSDGDGSFTIDGSRG
jgi:uncharacterized protein YegL/DNA-directed RNA polymerase subunit RPC12/RpoP